MIARAIGAFAFAAAAAFLGWASGDGVFLLRVAGVAAVAVLLAVIGIGAAGKWRQASRDMDQAVNSVCRPCNGEPGRCTCACKCANPACGADDTGLTRWTEEEIAALRGERELPR
jgi:hypothetical protein